MGQAEYSRFSITPYLGLGMVLPGEQQRISGGEWMRYQYKILTMGQSVDATGKRGLDFKSTNRIGAMVNFQILDQLELSVGGGRNNLMRAYQPSLNYQYQGRLVGNLYQNLAYLEGAAGLTFYGSNLFFKAFLNYIPSLYRNSDRKAAKQPDGVDPGNFINQSGQGFRLTDSNFEQIKSSFYLAVGQEINLGDSPANLEIGFNLAPKPLFREQVDFYWDNAPYARNTINHTMNTVFVTLSQTLNFRKRRSGRDWLVKKSRNQKPAEEIDMGEQMLKVGEHLVLEHIQFDRSKSELDSAGMEELDRIFDFMKKYHSAKIEFSGHTSDEGGRRENIRLSEERAIACKSYLVSKGIAGSRIKTVGFGPKRTISDTNQALNRRVEMQIISVDQ